MGSGGSDNSAALALQRKQLKEARQQAEQSHVSALIAEQSVTPAVGRSTETDTTAAQSEQTNARSRLRGVRGTYTRFAQMSGASGNGSKDKLG